MTLDMDCLVFLASVDMLEIRSLRDHFDITSLHDHWASRFKHLWRTSNIRTAFLQAYDCVGLGIIRAIDPEAGLLYILTPVKEAELER